MNILTQRPINFFFSKQWVFHGVFLPERGAILQHFVPGEGAGLEGGPCGTRSLSLYPAHAEREETLSIQYQCLYQPSELYTTGEKSFIIEIATKNFRKAGSYIIIVSEFKQCYQDFSDCKCR